MDKAAIVTQWVCVEVYCVEGLLESEKHVPSGTWRSLHSKGNIWDGPLLESDMGHGKGPHRVDYHLRTGWYIWVWLGLKGIQSHLSKSLGFWILSFKHKRTKLFLSVENDMLRLELTAITSPMSWEVDWNKLLLDSVTYFRRLLKYRWEMMDSERKPLVWRTRVAVPAEFFIHWFFSSLVQCTESGY